MTIKQIQEAPVGAWFAFIYQDVSVHNVAIMRKVLFKMRGSGGILVHGGISLSQSGDQLSVYYDKEIDIPIANDSIEHYHIDTKSFRTVKQVFVRYMLQLGWGKLKIRDR